MTNELVKYLVVVVDEQGNLSMKVLDTEQSVIEFIAVGVPVRSQFFGIGSYEDKPNRVKKIIRVDEYGTAREQTLRFEFGQLQLRTI